MWSYLLQWHLVIKGAAESSLHYFNLNPVVHDWIICRTKIVQSPLISVDLSTIKKNLLILITFHSKSN